MTIIPLRRLLALLPLFLVTVALHAQDVHTPKAGSDERKAIMDALRVPFERDLKQEVIFKVDVLKVSEDWAVIRFIPQKPGGGEIDYKRTHYREQVEADMFEPTGEALLQMDGGPDSWKVVKWRFGATDSEMSNWIKKYDAPASLDR